MWLGPALCEASTVPTFRWQWQTHTCMRKNLVFSSAGWPQHLPNTGIFISYQEDTWHAWTTQLLVAFRTWSWEGNDPSAIPSSTVWTFPSQEYGLLTLVPEPKSCSSHLFPGDSGSTEHYTRSVPNRCVVSPCSANQLPFSRLETAACQGFLCP